MASPRYFHLPFHTNKQNMHILLLHDLPIEHSLRLVLCRHRLWYLLKQPESLKNLQITAGDTDDKLIHSMMLINFTFVFWRLWMVITKTSPSLWSLNSRFCKVKDLILSHKIIIKIRLKFPLLPLIYLNMVHLTMISIPKWYSMELCEDQWLTKSKICRRKQAALSEILVLSCQLHVIQKP